MDKETETTYDYIVDNQIATESEIALVCSINGTSKESLNDIIYSKTGYRSVDQLIEMNDE